MNQKFKKIRSSLTSGNETYLKQVHFQIKIKKNSNNEKSVKINTGKLEQRNDKDINEFQNIKTEIK